MSSDFRRRRFLTYMIPFFALLFLCFLIVAIIYVTYNFYGQEQRIRNKEIVFFTTSAQANLLPWGSEKWDFLLNGSPILEGDMITTSNPSKSMVTFFGKNIIRIDSNATFFITALEENVDEKRQVKVGLSKGRFWIDWQHGSEDELEADLQKAWLNTKNALVDVYLSDPLLELRVIKGRVSLNIVDNSEKELRLLDKQEVSAGFMIRLGQDEMELFKKSYTVNLSEPIEKTYLADSWYVYNQNVSLDPNEFRKASLISLDQSNKNFFLKPKDNLPKDDTNIVIDIPQDGATFINEVFYLNGEVSPNVDMIEVIALSVQKSDYHLLKKFKPGDSEFSYVAKKEFGNLAKGFNRFRIMATSWERKETVIKEVALKVE